MSRLEPYHTSRPGVTQREAPVGFVPERDESFQ